MSTNSIYSKDSCNNYLGTELLYARFSVFDELDYIILRQGLAVFFLYSLKFGLIFVISLDELLLISFPILHLRASVDNFIDIVHSLSIQPELLLIDLLEYI